MREEEDGVMEDDSEEEEENILFITDPEVSNQLRREENAKKHALDFSKIEREVPQSSTTITEPLNPLEASRNKMMEGVKFWMQQPFPKFNPERAYPFQCIYRYQFPILSSSQQQPNNTSSFQPRAILQNQQRKEQSISYLNTTEGNYAPIHDTTSHVSLNEAMQKVMNQFRQDSNCNVQVHVNTKLKEKKKRQEQQLEEKKRNEKPTPTIQPPKAIVDDDFDIFDDIGEYNSEVPETVVKSVETQSSHQDISVKTIQQEPSKPSVHHNKFGEEYQFYEVYDEDEDDDEMLMQESKQKHLEDTTNWNVLQEQSKNSDSKQKDPSSTNKKKQQQQATNKKRNSKVQQVEQILSKKSKHF